MVLYIAAIFTSAFLLFQIQPLIGKYILPWFGGTPAVWSASMLFFQVLLTGGYAYAYWLVGRLAPRRQGLVHLSLLGLAVALLAVNGWAWGAPTLPDSAWRPQDISRPLLDVLMVLFVAVGLPYFLLSTNSTLLQAWFNRDLAGKSPYWLYALSNVGSLLGLLSYPILVEPQFSLGMQSWLWSVGFGVFAALVGYLSIKTLRRAPGPVDGRVAPTGQPLSVARLLMWALMAAIASLMLLAATSQITQEVAAIPFLWVLPLTAYILSFILTFSGERWYDRRVFLPLLFVVTMAYFYVILNPQLSILFSIAVHLALLFVIAMICHGELYALRPDPAHLTSFYLMVSIGGALGGIAVNLIAPYVFDGFWEFQIGLGAAWLLMLALMLVRPRPFTPGQTKWVVAVTALAAFSLVGVLYIQVQALRESSLLLMRNFYGVVRVTENNAHDPQEQTYRMYHGTTLHGFQYADPAKRHLPTSYFTEGSGIALALINHPVRPNPMRIGVLGLGVGVQAAYGQPGDVMRFYEINPDVITIAEGAYFSYLRDSQAEIQLALGDARLVLERELAAGQPQNFDLLVMDAFSSVSIPAHLLTKEAFVLYLDHLTPDGIIAVNITNRHLNLTPVLWNVAEELNLYALYISQTPDEANRRASPNKWVLLSRDPATLSDPVFQSVAVPLSPAPPNLRLWTDDYSNLFQILK